MDIKYSYKKVMVEVYKNADGEEFDTASEAVFDLLRKQMFVVGEHEIRSFSTPADIDGFINKIRKMLHLAKEFRALKEQLK